MRSGPNVRAGFIDAPEIGLPEMSLGQEVHHQLIEVVWALQRHHV